MVVYRVPSHNPPRLQPPRSQAVGPLAAPASGEDAAATPAPVVVSSSSRPGPRRVVIARAQLEDDYRAGTQPAVISRSAAAGPRATIISRAHLEDEHRLGTQPIVVSAARVPGWRSTLVQSRSSLEDAAPGVAVTPGPVVVSPQPSAAMLARRQALVSRAHLEDEFYPGTQPYVLSPRRAQPASSPSVQSRSGLDDDAAASVTTPAPVVVSGQPPRQFFAARPALITRAHLEDEFYAGTRPNVFSYGRPLSQSVIIQSRSGLEDLTVVAVSTPLAVIISAQTARQHFAPRPVVAARAHLIDDYYPGVQPVVVSSSPAAGRRVTIITRAHLELDGVIPPPPKRGGPGLRARLASWVTRRVRNNHHGRLDAASMTAVAHAEVIRFIAPPIDDDAWLLLGSWGPLVPAGSAAGAFPALSPIFAPRYAARMDPRERVAQLERDNEILRRLIGLE